MDVAQPKPFKELYSEGIWNRSFVANITTRMALPFTRVFLRIGLTPTQVSLLSLAISIAGMAVLALAPIAYSAWLGGGLLIVGLLWDHCDGQVARATGTGTLAGGLLDTIIDRWVEVGWIAALAVGAVVRPSHQGVLDWPAWAAVAVPAIAAFSIVYFRWSMIQHDLYMVQKELKLLRATTLAPAPLVLDVPVSNRTKGGSTTFYIPFLFNRDVTIWLLFAATVVPDPLAGLAVVAAAHVAKGLEKNWYTFGDLKKETNMLGAMLGPDYHK